MEYIDLLRQLQITIHRDSIHHDIKLLVNIAIPRIRHIRMPQLIILFQHKDVPLLKNVSNIVCEKAMHLIFDDIDEAHLCETLHDYGIVTEVGHL